jgi:hypothetical protein
MSVSEPDPNDPESLRDLWARYASQGLFRDPILQDGYLSKTRTITEVVDPDGNRQD